MVVSLFSIFDTSLLSPYLSWMGPFLLLLGLVSSPGLIYMPLSYLAVSPLRLLKPEFDMMLGSSTLVAFTPLFLGTWVYLLLLNFSGLFPYVYTCTSYISFTLCMAMTFWAAVLLFGWFTSPGKMLMALVPNGTPFVLMPLMVLIESISMAIRPVTLSVRLMANMVAGHLLLSLCGEGFESYLSMSLSFLCQTMLMVLESAVAAIQAYVFTVLVLLYSKEVSVAIMASPFIFRLTSTSFLLN